MRMQVWKGGLEYGEQTLYVRTMMRRPVDEDLDGLRYENMGIYDEPVFIWKHDVEAINQRIEHPDDLPFIDPPEWAIDQMQKMSGQGVLKRKRGTFYTYDQVTHPDSKRRRN